MAWNYLWTLWRIFTTQYVIVYRVSVGVFYFFSLKFRVIFMVIDWAFLKAQGHFFSFLSHYSLTVLSLIQRPT